MDFVVLGAGMMGRAVVYDLARARDVRRVIVADFDLGRAREVARKFGRGKARAAFADVRETSKLARLLRGATAVVNCTQYNWNLEVMKAALVARVNYLDLGGLYHMTRRQFLMDADFRRIGKIAIAGMGGAPGTTNIMARHLCDRMERVDSIVVYNASTDLRSYDSPIAYTFSIATILDELTLLPVAFRGGRFVERPLLSDPVVGWFPAPIGKVTLRNSIHSELGTLPISFRGKGVKEVYFKINYPPELVGLVRNLTDVGFTSREPVGVNGSRVAPRDVLLALLNRNAPKVTARDVETIRVVVNGRRGRRRVAASAESTAKYSTSPAFSAVARDTGFPAAIGALILGRGQYSGIGVQAPENVVPPGPFFRELAMRGMPVRVKAVGAGSKT
jgi:lysine 6-dehydrogenase